MSDRGDIGKSDINYTKQIIVHEKYIKFKQWKKIQRHVSMKNNSRILWEFVLSKHFFF
jgi:hypothetical protein